MRHQHISLSSMEKFLRAELGREEMSAVVDHLLGGCPECSALAHRITDESGTRLVDDLLRAEPPASGWNYEPSFASASARLSGHAERISRDKLSGLGLYLELTSLPPEERRVQVEKDSRYAHWGLYDLLLGQSRRRARSKPQAALESAELAVSVARRLEAPGALLSHDFLAAAHGARANVRRILADFAGAASDLKEAWSAFASGTADPGEEAGLRRLEGYLLLDLGSFERAAERFGEAGKIYRAIGDRGMQARVFVQQAEAVGYVNPADAVARLSRALPWIGRADEPRLTLAARHNLLWFLNDAGRAAEARPVLSTSLPLYELFDEPAVTLRRLWLEGRIDRSLAGAAAAETPLRLAWEGFAELGLGHDLALVAVDLLESLTTQGKTDASLDLAARVLPMLSAYGLHAEGIEVWLLLTHTLKRRSVEHDSFARAASYFRRNFKYPRKRP